jgi:hypothetical protein
MAMKKYLVTYVMAPFGHPAFWTEVIDTHPLEWVKDPGKKGDYGVPLQIALINFWEVPEDYKLY